MRIKVRLALVSATVALLAAPIALGADGPSIDRLISKLPPPEKFVDPASVDPLAKQIAAAMQAKNFGLALDASRRLAGKYPKSAGAQMLHAFLASAFRRYPEAAGAYRKLVAIRPDLAAAYAGLALSEAAQQRFSSGFANFQQVTRLAPKVDLGWIGLSFCAEKLGRSRDSLEYARRGTVAAPSSAAAWQQLAHSENRYGSKQAAANARARAIKLRQANASRTAHRS